MTQTLGGGVEALRRAMSGPVCVSGDAGYDEARSIWNGDIDRYPAVVARCTSSADVAAAVVFAGEQGLEISVRGGGHGFSGSAVCDGGLMIDLSLLNAVRVDAAARRAFVGGGAKLADLDAATQEHGLAAPAGVISHTGVGGLTLGGGMGWLTNLLGLSVDNLESAEVVFADGSITRAATRRACGPVLGAARRWWQLRRGHRVRVRLAPVGPMVHLGMFFWALERGREVFGGREAMRGCRRASARCWRWRSMPRPRPSSPSSTTSRRVTR